MKLCSFALISDLHVGSAARSIALHPGGKKGFDPEFLQKTITFLENRLSGVNLLVIAGDIAHEGQPNEVELAGDALDKIAKSLGSLPDGIVCVPGNHDVDWKVSSLEDNTGLRQRQRYAPLSSSSEFVESILSSGQGNLLEGKYFAIWETSKVLCVGYNSAWHDSKSELIHHGFVDPDHLDALREELKAIDNMDRVRIFLTHHHLLKPKRRGSTGPDFSDMENAEDLLGLLSEYGFDIVVHGHTHRPNCITMSFESPRSFSVLSAGSMSALAPADDGLYFNQIHRVTVQGRDAEGSAYGLLESWVYDPSSLEWKDSSNALGIQHRKHWGSYMLTERVKTRLNDALVEAFALDNPVFLSDLLREHEDLGSLEVEELSDLLSQLSPTLGFAIMGRFETADCRLFKVKDYD